MDELTPTFLNVTSWNVLHHLNTKGTRDKNIIVEPETQLHFFFKGSKMTLKGEIRYEKEFWSEIVSSKVGQLLGFKMLDYNIAYNELHIQKIGCISKTMVNLDVNELKEGVNYLTGYDSDYNPDDKEDQKKYTFNFICESLIHHNLKEYITDMVNLIIFDSIIGNSDRHQENWGIITISQKSQQIAESITKDKTSSQIISTITSLFKNKDENMLKHLVQPLHKFSPIYDSGCCLGR